VKTPLFVFDDQDNLLCIFEDYSEAPFQDDVRSEDVSLEIMVPADHEDSEHFEGGNQVAFRDLEGRFRLFKIRETDDNDGKALEKHVICLSAMDELNGHIVEDKRPQNVPAENAIDDALLGSRWQRGTVAPLGLNSTNFYYISARESLTKITNIWGGELVDRIELDPNTGKISARYIDLLDRRGMDRGKRFEIDKDIEDITRTVLYYPRTAMYGRGKSLQTEGGGFSRKLTFEDVEWTVMNGDPVDKPLGQKWVGDPDALAIHGTFNPSTGDRIHVYGIHEDNDVDDPAVLLQKTWDALQAERDPKVRYKMSVMTFYGIADYEHEQAFLGDTGVAIDRQVKPEIFVQSRIIKMKYDLANPEEGEVTIGNFLDLNEDQKRIDWVIEQVSENSGSWESGGTVEDTSFPDTVPPAPTNVVANGLFKTITLKWDFDPSSYIAAYEVYASQVSTFVPGSTNLVFRGKTGGMVLQAGNDQQWYFQVRAINTHGTAGPFAAQVSAQTVRISESDFDELTVVDAFIQSIAADVITSGVLDASIVEVVDLNADNITSGRLKAQYVEIGAQSVFKDGTDPRPALATLIDRGFVHGKTFWSHEFAGEIVPSATQGTIVENAEATQGPNVWQFVGESTVYGKNAIPVNTAGTYRVTLRVKQTVDPTVVGTSNVYAGVVCLDSAFQLLGYNYFAANNVPITVLDDWQSITGTITGEAIATEGNFEPGTKYVRPVFIVNFDNGDGTVLVDACNLEDISEIWGLDERLTSVEVSTTAENILSTVTSSQSFQDKADKSDISGLASTGYVDGKATAANEYTDGKISDINDVLGVNQDEEGRTVFEQISAVDQRATQLDIKFTSSGGVNLIKNSVGFAGFDFWNLVIDVDGLGDPIGTATTRQNAELTERGAGSGLVLSGAKITQTISTVADQYTFSVIVDKAAAGSGYLKVTYDDTVTEQIDFLSGTEYNYELFTITVNPAGNTVILELYGDNAGETVFTSVMANIGTAALQWQHSAGEIYNTNVLMNQNGIKVISSAYEGYTLVTPQEFSGYAEVAGVMTRVFTLNKDVTEVSKLKAVKEISMGPIKVIPVTTGGYKGWAFIAQDTEV
jgi:phage minor structural protein